MGRAARKVVLTFNCLLHNATNEVCFPVNAAQPISSPMIRCSSLQSKNMSLQIKKCSGLRQREIEGQPAEPTNMEVIQLLWMCG
jgi:hypothetical protein